MSLIELQIIAEKDDVFVTVQDPPVINVQAVSTSSINLQAVGSPGIIVVAAGNFGPPGPAGQWVSMTQAEYNALSSPDPDTLYVIVE